MSTTSCIKVYKAYHGSALITNKCSVAIQASIKTEMAASYQVHSPLAQNSQSDTAMTTKPPEHCYARSTTYAASAFVVSLKA